VCAVAEKIKHSMDRAWTIYLFIALKHKCMLKVCMIPGPTACY